MATKQVLATAWAFLLCGAIARAGYEAPCFIDGCKSMDGRYVVTAEMVAGKQVHGPFQWRFVWKDTKLGKTIVSEAKGIQKGQIYAQIYLAPDGETFALFNHLTIWSADKSHMHGPPGIRDRMTSPEWKTLDDFSHRVIVYRKDGTIIKSLSVHDVLTAEEWQVIGPMFNRIEWLNPYDGLFFKQIVRPAYAFCRISPDYTILEVTVKPTRNDKMKKGRVVRIALTDGKVLEPEEWPTEKNKVPVAPYVGEIRETVLGHQARERYQPSLDPVRLEGKLLAEKEEPKAPPKKAEPIAPSKLELVKDGFTKLDTPAWWKDEKCLVMTDLEQKKLFRLDLPNKLSVLREEACRGKIGADGKCYFVMGGSIACGKDLSEKPVVVLAKSTTVRDLSLNDLAASSNGFLYFTTLKDPDKGRLTVVDTAKGTAAVAFDGENHPALSNPNGVALSSDGEALYVGISNYKDRSHSGVYRFPIKSDGSLDVESGKQKKWAPVEAPDGIAVGPDGHVYITAGASVHVYSPEAKARGSIKIPKDSGTNLCFGGEDGRTLFVTTNKALYSARIEPIVKP